MAKNMLDGATTVSRQTMLTDVLDAPISELAMSNNVDVGKNLFNAGALENN